jgi:MFS family permease
MAGTMSDKINLPYVLFLAATAATGGLLFGFDVAIISGAGPFLVQHFALNDLSLGVAFSSLLFGCIIGSGVAGRITDRYGRRRILLWVAVLFALTSAATGLAWSFQSFLAARFLGGLAVGAVSLASPMYVSEIAPPTLRGRLGALYQMSVPADRWWRNGPLDWLTAAARPDIVFAASGAIGRRVAGWSIAGECFQSDYRYQPKKRETKSYPTNESGDLVPVQTQADRGADTDCSVVASAIR